MCEFWGIWWHYSSNSWILGYFFSCLRFDMQCNLGDLAPCGSTFMRLFSLWRAPKISPLHLVTGFQSNNHHNRKKKNSKVEAKLHSEGDLQRIRAGAHKSRNTSRSSPLTVWEVQLQCGIRVQGGVVRVLLSPPGSKQEVETEGEEGTVCQILQTG